MEKDKKVETGEAKEERKGDEVIAFRRACKATGTGLSHYILMDRKGE